MENKQEHWGRSVLFYVPRLIASFMSALAMDEKGLSLKKILAAFSTWVAADITEKMLAPNNVLILVLIWLVYAGILVGIYSLTEITGAIKQVKGEPK